MAQKRNRWRKWLFRTIVIAFFAWMIAVIGVVVTILNYDSVDERQEADAIVVLGAGLSRTGRPGFALTRRSLLAAELYQQGYAPNIICTGGQADNQVRSEAEACAEVLSQWRDVPRSAILLEDESRSTEENALFSRDIIEAQGFEDVLLITDSFHMLRAQFIFNTRGINVYPVAVPRAQMRDGHNYDYYVTRELAALHWQVFKDLLNIPVTHVP